MTLNERVSYIRGLVDGLKLDESKDEVKVINAIVDLLEDMAMAQTDMEDLYDEMSLQVDEIDEDLSEVEEIVYSDGECDCCDDYDDEEDPFYEVTCAKCGKTICVSEDVLLEGEIECPNCGENLEFDFSDLFEDEDECDCGCDCCDSSDDDFMS